MGGCHTLVPLPPAEQVSPAASSGLCRSRTAQELAAADLATEVKRLASLLSTDFLGKLVHDLNRRLFEMIHSADSHDRLGAVMAIGSTV